MRSESTTPRRCVPACIALVCALTVLLATPLGADEGEPGDPIVLTNEDVERITGAKPKPGDAEPGGARPGSRRTSPDQSGRVADSWQEEYYRLKAQALQRAMDRGEQIESAEPEAVEPGAPPAKAGVGSSYSSAPTCLYGSRGNLIFAPRGVDCRENRQLGASRRDATPGSREHASCLYGVQGEVLHEPPGRTCPRRRR